MPPLIVFSIKVIHTGVGWVSLARLPCLYASMNHSASFHAIWAMGRMCNQLSSHLRGCTAFIRLGCQTIQPVSDHFSQLPSNSASFRAIQPTSEQFSRLPSNSVSFRAIQPASEKFSQLPRNSASFQEIQPASEKFSQYPTNSASFWEIHPASEQFSQLLRNLASFWAIQSAFEPFGLVSKQDHFTLHNQKQA